MITATHKGKYYDVEYSVVNVSELERELRIDAEYYEPYYLEVEEKIDKLNHDFLYSLASNEYKTFNAKTCDSFYYIEISNVNLTTGDYEIENLPCSFAPSRAKKIVEKYDILISTVRPNRNAVVFIFEVKQKPLVASTGFCKLKVIDDKISPLYLFILFKTKYYIDFLVRKITATMYPAVSENDIMGLKVPIPSDTFQKLIEKLVLKAYNERQQAEELYKQAEETLLEELGLKNWKPKTKKIKMGGREIEEEENISIRMLSDVLKADRTDAEYWEPKYDEIEKLIKNYKDGWDYLPNLVELSKKKIKVEKDRIYNYIELADINSNLGVVNQTKQIKESDLPSRARMEVEKGYVIMSSVEGSIGKIALINSEKPNLVASTGFFVFKEKDLNKETLLVLLKILSKKYIIREAQGTILTAIPYNSLNRVVLPKINATIQQKISSLIQQSFKSRENSKKLLEIAKKTVELYIEKDEQEGINYAEEEIRQLGIEID